MFVVFRLCNPFFTMSLFLFYVLVQRPPSCCWSTVYITVWHHLTMVTVGQGMQTLPVDHSEQLPDSISTCDINRRYYMLLLFLFVLLLFFVVFFCLFGVFLGFFRDRNMISMGTVKFTCYVVITILVNLGKP